MPRPRPYNSGCLILSPKALADAIFLGCLLTDLAQIWWTFDKNLGQKYLPNIFTDVIEKVCQVYANLPSEFEA